MGSSRLPGKTMMDLSGMPLISRLLSQVIGAKTVDEIIVATSTNPSDDIIEIYLKNLGFKVSRGSEDDVLDRYLKTALEAKADIIVRLTADCPLHSPDTVDEVVLSFLNANVDYASNTNPYTRPDGQDVEVFNIKTLIEAAKIASMPLDREHVTPWMRRNPDISKINVMHKPPHYSSMRWSVDYIDDMQFVCAVWSYLDAKGVGPFKFEDIMAAVKDSGAVQGKATNNEGFYLSFFKMANSEAASPLCLDESEKWLRRSAKVIPGGAQTYSKSWRHHIRGVTPIFLSEGRGAVVKDVDGNQYVDLIQGLLPNILGYAHKEVDEAVYNQARRGHSFSLPNPIEVELAERLCRLIPCAEMVRFGKNGSDATAGAVRVARAFTGRDRVAVCGYHGWQDWFIGTTSRSLGVPNSVRELAHTFPYNDLNALDKLLSSYRAEFAAVIMEPVNFIWPEPNYLEGVKNIAHKHGALLIFDEICSGFHYGLGGAQQLFNVLPDMATFGKAMGNGWPISCVVGRKDVMKVFEDAFISFTFAGDLSAMAGAIKVLEILENGDAYARMAAAGTKLQDGAKVMAEAAGLGNIFRIQGHPNWCLFSFVDNNGVDDPITRALWVQEVTRRGVLILTTFNICAALNEDNVKDVLSAFAFGFKRIAEARRLGIAPEDWLDGPIPLPAFRARG